MGHHQLSRLTDTFWMQISIKHKLEDRFSRPLANILVIISEKFKTLALQVKQLLWEHFP